jgi:GT2 family glycosyltransferase
MAGASVVAITRSIDAMRAGKVWSVPPGGDFQSALSGARPGDTIVLQAGTRYVGEFHLPKKDGNDWITIQSTSLGGRRFPAAGTRIGPSDAAAMAKVIAPSGSAIVADAGAHHYRFIGIELAPATGVYLFNLVDLGSTATTIDAVPHDFVFDRCYLHGDQAQGTRRGIALNSGDATIMNSYFADFKEVGADSQAIAGWNGPGPFQIVNNYLEGSGENILFGGADPAIENLVPSDITIQRNTFSKPLAWRAGDPAFQGTEWTVKNLIELKNARRVTIDGNVFENNWVQAQNGFSILFTVRNQDGNAPWSTIEDVTFSNNIIRHVPAGINVLGQDDINRSQQSDRIAIRNNLFLDVGGSLGNGKLFQLLNGTRDVTIEHNTGFQTDALLFTGDTLPHTGVIFQNNIAPHNLYGIIGSGTGVGNPSIEQYLPGAVIRRNVMAGGNPSFYPPDNFFPSSLNDVQFVNQASGNFRLASTSQFHGKATDGRDPGADLDAIAAAMASPAPTLADGTGQLLIGRTAGIGSIVLPGEAGPLDGVEEGALFIFVMAVGLLAYVYVGYGGLMWLYARLSPHPVRRAPIRPSVAIVVVAWNEGVRIARRIQNLLSLDYPRELMEIVVASDGSTDDTVEAARRYEDRIRVVAFGERRGKPAVLNDVVSTLQTDVVVLADARQQFDAAAIRALVECLADPTVGAVSGELILRPLDSPAPVSEGAAAYWNYEKSIRRSESEVDSTVGVTGAIYAIRRSLFEPIPFDAILDDVLIPLRIARQGYRVVFEPAARAFDNVMATARDEFARKVRTIAGNLQLLGMEQWILSPFQNRLWLQTMSHKALRLSLPLLYLVVFVANAALLNIGVFRALLIAQVAFYVAAMLAHFKPELAGRFRWLAVPYEICFLNCAALVGFYRYLTRRHSVTWERPSLTTAHPTG